MTDENNPSTLHIRQAHVGEANELTQLAMESKAHWKYTPEQIQLWRAELTVPPEMIFSGNAYVGVVENSIVAMMVLVPGAMTWKLDYFFVAPQHMEQGIGKEMFQYAIDQARERGARAVTIDADPHAERFYLACGAIRSYAKAAPIADDSARIRPQMLFLIPSKKRY
jgi:GNAT superfamily N-acetyltransferase